MDPIDVLAIGVIGLGLGLSLSENWRIRVRIRRARRWRLGEMPEVTLGRVVGRVRALGDLTRSPLTGRPCVFYVAEVRSDFAPGNRRELGGVPFVLEDDSGRAIIDPAHATAALSVAITGALDRSEVTSAERALFARLQNTRPVERLESWTFLEGVVEPGATIEVLGAAIREPDPAASAGPDVYRGVSATRLRIAWARGFPLVISES